MNSAVLAVLAALTVDFNQECGKVRPELHSSGFGPMICSFGEQAKEEIKAMNFKSARTHDWALINPNQRVCDYFQIFPLMHLDPADEKNYVFGPTDYLLKRTREEMGMDVFYRLGTSIEHSGKKINFNVLVPDDFNKVAEIFAATVRHYNHGWANGFNWGIKYWEIWNEPEGYCSMWAPKGGTAHLSGEELKAKQVELRDKFVEFFVIVLKRLKTEFGDSIKVGGPALCCYNEEWLNAIFTACKAAGIAPDFVSWHGYNNDPMQYNREADAVRKICDSYGFTKCELIVNEWHYFGKNYNWDEMQRCDDPAVKAKIWEGPFSHNGIHSTCFTLAALANMQRSKLTEAYYYGCRHMGSWGYKDELKRKYKIYYGLKLFGQIMKDYTEICASESKDAITTFAVKNAAGKEALLVIDYGGSEFDLEFDVKGVKAGAGVKCTVLDNTHDLTEHPVKFENGKLSLHKNDFTSAAFLVEFE